ncbi:MAG: S41 family peptidase [Patescibacteria group bacterium]
MKKFLRLSFFLLGAAILVGTGFVAGVYLGYENRPAVEKIVNVTNKETPPERTEVDFEPFWKAWNVIDEKYVVTTGTTTEKVGSDKMVYGAIGGLVESLGDPYSVFFPPAEKKMFEEEIRGNFGGVGIEVDLVDGVPTVIAPLEDSPAQKAGVLPKDRILKINDTPTKDLPLERAISLIRGEIGTAVTLTMGRNGAGKTLEFKLIRDTIQVPTIKTEALTEDVFVIRLYNFGATASGLFRKALKEFAESKKQRLLLDLRGNPGGYLESAVDIASWFLPEGEVVVTEDHGLDSETRVYKSKGYKAFKNDPRMVILVDGGSASASEILAGALAEHGKATMVGKKTFGKGSVQELVPVTEDSSIKITIARWLTPKGHSLSSGGLEPEIVVEPAEGDKRGEKDAQQAKAVEVLLQMK